MHWRDGRRDRVFKRYDVEGVRGSLQFRASVSVHDLSAGGMQVEGTSQLAIGRIYRFRLHHDERTLDVAGRVAWCSLSGTRKTDSGEVVSLYRAGVAFDESLSPDGKAIVEFMGGYVTIDPHQRIFGRFGIESSTEATAGTRHDYEVLRISQSGLLVRTDFVPLLEALFDLSMQLGDEVLFSQVRVAYVNDLEGDAVELGLEFVELGEAPQELLLRFLGENLAEGDPQLTDY